MNIDTGERQISSELDKVRARSTSPLRSLAQRYPLPYHHIYPPVPLTRCTWR